MSKVETMLICYYDSKESVNDDVLPWRFETFEKNAYVGERKAFRKCYPINYCYPR